MSPVSIYGVAETCQALKISRWTFYRLLQEGKLRSITIGRRRFVVASDLDAFVSRLQEEATP